MGRVPFLGFRIGVALLAPLAGALAGADVGLAVSQEGGFEELGAAIQGFLLGAVAGLAAGVVLAVHPPSAPSGRRAVLAALAAVCVMALSVQEALD